MKLKILLCCAAATLFAGVFAGGAAAAPINPISPGSLTVSGLEDFETLSPGPFPGASYDGVLDLDGVSFAERFAGQTLGASGTFDTLSGTPSGPLLLVAGATGENVVAADSGGVGIAGLGPLGYPDLSANGEGALAILFDVDTPEVGIEFRGTQGGSATFDFWQRDGTLIDSLTLSSLSDGFYAFARDGGVFDIAGITVTNDDVQGFGFDNVRFYEPVPEPGTGVLLAVGLLGIGLRARRG